MRRGPPSGPRSRPARRRIALWLAAALGGGLVACGGGGGGGGAAVVGTPGALRAKPEGGLYVEDVHSGGSATRLRLVEIVWGRLVDVHGLDASGEVVSEPTLRDFVIGESVLDAADDWRVETNPITGETRLVILREPGAPDRGNGTFAALLARATRDLTGVAPRSPDAGPFPPFSYCARNAALSLRFDDLLDADAASVEELADHVRVLAGYPPTVPLPARVIFDPSHGGVAEGRFHPTRVIVDLTVSETEAADSPVVLLLNSLGLPRADPASTAANVVLRVPTRADPGSGLFGVLHNVAGRPVDPSACPPVDLASPTRDLVRAMRSGHAEDPNNGFLLDFRAPRVIGAWPATVEAAAPADAGGFAWDLTLRFTGPCRKRPEPGEIVNVGERYLEVLSANAPDDEGRTALRARLLNAEPPRARDLLGLATFRSVYRGGLEVENGCWVQLSPLPRVPPSTDVSPDTQVTVRFSEPMDPDSARPFDNFRLVRGNENVEPDTRTIVVGSIRASADLRDMTFRPVLPLPHRGDRAFFHVRLAGPGGVTDLAGNTLAEPLPRVELTVDPEAPRSSSASFVLRFDSIDELPTIGAPDLRGQFVYQFARGTIRPREVLTASRAVEPANPIVGVMAPFAPGVATPLSPLGSKLQAVWRYADLGWSIRDETKFNLDVVDLHWSPARSNVNSDFFEQLEIRLAHSRKLPDEQRRSPITGGMRYPLSGLFEGPTPYEENLLADPDSPQVVVRSRAGGYRLEPRDLTVTAAGLPLLPWRLDPPDRRAAFTWRDTGVITRGGHLGAGVPLDAEQGAPLYLEDTAGSYAPPGEVPAVGLPLLMEFRCYPSETGIGLNALAIALASNASAAPNFRAFSTGGFDFMGRRVVKDPDLEDAPTGGFNPGSRPPGRPTARTADNALYLGQLDYVTRISRVHTVWIDTESTAPRFAEVVLEPPDEARPSGTAIAVDFRGATRFDGAEGRPFSALGIDAYGDPVIGTIVFHGGDPRWRRDPRELDGARYVQMRISFSGNPDAGIVAELSALGVAYRTD